MWKELELTLYDVLIQHISHYTMGTPQIICIR